MEQKIKWTEEMIQYLKENYQKYLNRELADHLKIKRTLISAKLKQLNLKRTPEELKKLLQRIEVKNKENNIFTINSDPKIKEEHLIKWKSENGEIPIGRILIYNKIHEYSNLKLVTYKQYSDFIKSKGYKLKISNSKKKRIEKEKKWAEKQLKPIEKKKQMSLGETCEELKSKGRVPVRIDHKTIVFRKVK